MFGAHMLLLADPMLADLVEQGIAAGRPAPIALDDAVDEVVRRLLEIPDPYLRERIEDIEDLRSRILGHLLGIDDEGDVGARVVVGTRTTPSLVVELKARGALGACSELGGPTSHGALLARALGVPAVAGIESLTSEIAAGDVIVVDGDEGLVVVRPTAATRAEYERRQRVAERERTEFLRYRDLPATTADGLLFALQANVALGTDVEVARDNVQAFAIAAAGRELRILIPMVSSVEDIVRIKELVAAALAQGGPSCAGARIVYGAMIETPAGVEIVAELAREVEFFSIGTNDLIQYTLVVDREDARMSSPRHAYHPAIFRMIARIVERAHAAGKRVTVCGEMASRPDLALALLALGVDALSVAPRGIPELKRALACSPVQPLRAGLADLLALPTAAGVEAALRGYLRDGTSPSERHPFLTPGTVASSPSAAVGRVVVAVAI